MTCGEAKQILTEMALDEAAPEQRRQVRAHLEGCEVCRAEAGAVTAEMTMMRKLLVEGLPQEEVPRRITFVAAPAGGGTLGWLWRWKALAIPAAAAAALVLTAGGLSLARTRVVVEQGRWEIAFGAAAATRSIRSGSQRATQPQAPDPNGALETRSESSGFVTSEQAARLVAEALVLAEARHRSETMALVDAAARRLDKRNFTALSALAERMVYFESTQNTFYKDSEGTRRAIELVAARLPAEKGERQ